jgi:hypothetical protein
MHYKQLKLAIQFIHSGTTGVTEFEANVWQCNQKWESVGKKKILAMMVCIMS